MKGFIRKQAGDSLGMQNQCAEIKIRAERRMGELLPEQIRKPGETDKKIMSNDATLSQAPRLKELDISPLAASIHEIGLLNPITVTAENVLIAGLHRLEACKFLKHEFIAVTVLDVDGLKVELACD